MNKLEVALFHVNEAIQDLELLKQYQEDIKNYDYEDVVILYDTIPTKQAVYDNIKAARKLLNYVRKEVEML
jgi:hypothetical protein